MNTLILPDFTIKATEWIKSSNTETPHFAIFSDFNRALTK